MFPRNVHSYLFPLLSSQISLVSWVVLWPTIDCKVQMSFRRNSRCDILSNIFFQCHFSVTRNRLTMTRSHHNADMSRGMIGYISHDSLTHQALLFLHVLCAHLLSRIALLLASHFPSLLCQVGIFLF